MGSPALVWGSTLSVVMELVPPWLGPWGVAAPPGPFAFLHPHPTITRYNLLVFRGRNLRLSELLFQKDDPTEGRNVDEAQRRGRLIARLREERLWTREALAREAGVTISTVTNAEQGKVQLRFGTLRKLAN